MIRAGRILFTVLLAVTSAAGLLGAGRAEAHIKSGASQFPDIEYSDARFDIVLLVGAGVIPQTPVFEPDAKFSRANLAAWAALTRRLAEGGETPDTQALAAAALKQGVVDSLQGNATYADINKVFFNNQLSVKQPDAVPTKAQAAGFIADHLDTETGGTSLLDQLDLQPGPTGKVTKVESGTAPDGDSAYTVTIAGQTHMLYEHGRVADGPTDLIQWQGREIRRSFLHHDGDRVVWAYLEAKPVQAAAADDGPAAAQQQAAPVKTNRNLLYGLSAAVVVLGVLLFFRRKRVA